MTNTLKISGFNSQFDQDPERAEVTWEQLVEALSAPRVAECTLADKCYEGECPHKGGPAWSPATWPAGESRAKLTVDEVAVLVVDVDHVASDDELLAIYGRVAAFRHFVHASHSDRPGDRCVRIGIAVSRPIEAAEFSRLLNAVLAMLDLPGDKRTRDASRLFYWPSRPSDACDKDVADGSGYLFATDDGKLLDVDGIMANLDEDDDDGLEYTATEFEVPNFEGAPAVEKLEAAAKVIGAAWPDDDRHRAQLALAGALARAGWPTGLIAEFCARVAEIDDPGKRKHVRLAPGAARSSVDKVRAGKNVEGWPTVIEYCGEAAVAQARELLGLGPSVVDEGFASSMERRVAEMRAAKAARDAAALVYTPTIQDGDSATGPDEAPIEYEFSDAPTATEMEATLTAARRRLSSSKRPHEVVDGRYLSKVVACERIADPQEFFQAAIAVVRHAPPNATDDQIRVQLLNLGKHGAEPNIVTLARDAARVQREQRQLRAKVDEASLDEFRRITSGQRAGQIDNASEHNIRVALTKMGVQVQFNAFSEEEELIRDGSRVNIDDNQLKTLRNEFERLHGFKPSKDDLWDTVSVIARENSYHPVREYLDGAEKTLACATDDLADLPSTWLIRYAGAEDTPYVRAVSQLMLVAAVRRVRDPGCTFQEMMVLESPKQGKGKSTGLRTLAVRDEWFTDDFTLQGDSKKMIEQSAGRWIIEVGELRGMSQGDHNAMKQYLSRTHDRARMSYDRKVRWVARQFVPFATTNDEQYLKDPTGNRRIWPIRVREFDVEALREIRDRLWAEASRLERENPSPDFIRLDKSLYEAAAGEQSKREVLSSYFVKLEDALDGAVGTIGMQDVWKLLGFEDNRPPNRAQVMEISSVMSKLDFHQNDDRGGTKKQRCYSRGEGAQREIPIRVVGGGASPARVVGSETARATRAMPQSQSSN